MWKVNVKVVRYKEVGFYPIEAETKWLLFCRQQFHFLVKIIMFWLKYDWIQNTQLHCLWPSTNAQNCFRFWIWNTFILMIECKTAVTPLLMHWSYGSIALNPWYKVWLAESAILILLWVLRPAWPSKFLWTLITVYFCSYWKLLGPIFMMTSSNGNIFHVTGPLCGEFIGHSEFPSQRPVTRIFDVFFDLRLNKPLSKQPWSWWFETPSRSLRRHCND